MIKFLFQGQGSYRFVIDGDFVLYVDPYAGTGYDLPADIILVTHRQDHRVNFDLALRKPSCRLITDEEALVDGKLKTFEVAGIKIEATEATNFMREPMQGVGYLITFPASEHEQWMQIYCSGNTAKTKQMESFSKLRLDYALLNGDDDFNMGPEEAAECARIIGAERNILIHNKTVGAEAERFAEEWSAPNRLIVAPGQEIPF